MALNLDRAGTYLSETLLTSTYCTEYLRSINWGEQLANHIHPKTCQSFSWKVPAAEALQ